MYIARTPAGYLPRLVLSLYQTPYETAKAAASKINTAFTVLPKIRLYAGLGSLFSIIYLNLNINLDYFRSLQITKYERNRIE